MARTIIAALRHRQYAHLRGNTFLIATELAHRMNSQGYGRVSYQYLAWKAHCCRRTAITQIAKLLDLGLIAKTVIRTKEGYAWNLYKYIGLRVHTASPPVTAHGAKVVRTLPDHEREKETSLREDIRNLEKGLSWCTPGSDAYEATVEKIARLTAVAGNTLA